MSLLTSRSELPAVTPPVPARLSSPVSAGLLVSLAVALLANLWVAAYVGQEHYIYHWDWSGYWMRFRDAGAMLLADPVKAALRLVSSVRNEDYNLLPVWPLAPFAWLFGGDRLPYLAAITTVYLVPAVLLSGWLVAHLHEDQRLWLPASATIALLHPLWVPVLRGYPDIVGLLIVAVLLHLHFRQPDAGTSLRRALATAALLCLLVVMRRWYAFWVVSFVPLLALAQLDALRRRGALDVRSALSVVRDAAVATIGFLALLFVVATPFAVKMVTTSYADIYAAYRLSESMGEVLAKLGAYFGLSVLAAALAGLFLMARQARTSALGLVLLAQSVLIFLLFARTQDFGEQHYYLLLPAVTLGLASLVARVWLHAAGLPVRLSLVALMLAGIGWSSFQVLKPEAGGSSAVPGLAQVRYPPLVRKDFEEIDRLHARLDALQRRQPGDLYVLASSTVLNSSIVLNHCQMSAMPWSFCSKVLTTHDVDRRDGFPKPFLEARYVVVTEPLQYHLRPEDQRVIGTLAHALTDRSLLGSAYERLPDTYALDGQVSAVIYRRVRDHDADALRRLQDEFLQHYPQPRYGFKFL